MFFEETIKGDIKKHTTKVQNKFQNKNNHTESINWKQILILERK